MNVGGGGYAAKSGAHESTGNACIYLINIIIIILINLLIK